MKRIASYFFQGLLLIVPLATTVFLVFKIFVLVDDLLPYTFFPGASALLIFAGITLVGVLGNTFFARQLDGLVNKIMKRLPLLDTVYSSVKDLLSAFVGQKRKFTNPVLIKLSAESNIKKLGFITQEDLTAFGIGEGLVAVYVPHSYAFSGLVYIVEKEHVTPIKGKSADVMKFIVSGGVAYNEEG